MDLFWQITLVEFLLNLAVFAAAVIAYGPVCALARRLPGHNDGIAAGILYGAATAIALLLPVHLSGGSSLSSQPALLALAAPLGGLATALAAEAIALAAAGFGWLFWGTFEHSITGMVVMSTAIGIVFRIAMERRNSAADVKFAYLQLPVLGALAALGNLADLWYEQGLHTALAAALPATISSTLATFILGTLLLHDKRRREAE